MRVVVTLGNYNKTGKLFGNRTITVILLIVVVSDFFVFSCERAFLACWNGNSVYLINITATQ